MADLGNGPGLKGAALPGGIVEEAGAPERLVVVWSVRDTTKLIGSLVDTGHLALTLSPAETPDLIEISGAPSLMLVDSDLLDESAVAALQQVQASSPHTRVVVLAGDGSGSPGLLTALRHGLSEVVGIDDLDAIQRLLDQDSPRAAAERVLAVGAHPDDVEIGCGATLLRHRAHNHPVTVLTLSRGALGGDRTARRHEAVSAAIAMSAQLLMGDLPDTRMEDAHETIGLIEGVIDVVRPTTVYVHSQHDNHQDHRAVHAATVIAARRVPQLLCYQSPSSRNGFAPTKFVPVDETIHAKVDVLASYRSQSTRHYLEPDLVVASARYWARQLPHLRYAEPFEVLRSSQ